MTEMKYDMQNVTCNTESFEYNTNTIQFNGRAYIPGYKIDTSLYLYI